MEVECRNTPGWAVCDYLVGLWEARRTSEQSCDAFRGSPEGDGSSEEGGLSPVGLVFYSLPSSCIHWAGICGVPAHSGPSSVVWMV